MIEFCLFLVLKLCTFLSSSKDLCTRGILRCVNILLSANKIFGIHGIFPEALIRSGLDFRAKLPHRLAVFSSPEARQVFGGCLLVISACFLDFQIIFNFGYLTWLCLNCGHRICIYLAAVNISDKVHIPLCISHSPFYSLFILHCV